MVENIKQEFAIKLFKHSNEVIHYLRLYMLSFDVNDIDYKEFDQLITDLKKKHSFLNKCKLNLNNTKIDLLHNFYYKKVLFPSLARCEIVFKKINYENEPSNENYLLIENVFVFTDWLFGEIKYIN